MGSPDRGDPQVGEATVRKSRTRRLPGRGGQRNYGKEKFYRRGETLGVPAHLFNTRKDRTLRHGRGASRPAPDKKRKNLLINSNNGY